MEAVLARIEEVEPRVQAFVNVTAEAALEQARSAQATLDHDREQAPVLTGVPIAVKDLFDVRGLVTTAGSRALADNVAHRDSIAWRRLREAGAVLVGKANTHEFAYGGTTEPTRNPWDLDRMVGGSSGGSAAALASGTCFGALGTDTAGSVRIPAALCGVVGLKPTKGDVSTRGVFPLSRTLDCVGPLARTPQDAALLHSVLRSTSSTSIGMGPLRTVRDLRVCVIPPQEALEEPVRQAHRAASQALEDAGAVVESLEGAPRLADATRVNFTIMAAEAGQVHRSMLASRGADYSPYVRERLQDALRTTASDYLEALQSRRAIIRDWNRLFTSFDVALLNGIPCTAPRAYVEQVMLDDVAENRDWVLCRDTAFANVTGHPALAVPAGVADGLPVGVQLTGRRHSEALLFAAGQAIFDRLASPIP
ncbi:MAG: amidase [Intrasporangium sp.]|uniref:amidase n=1 Tax=Intrasporangium sp. TaxID=1925024 RepID=UPI00264A1C1A|nr:amidase [Intrasporangium sp.]MDN5794130.1 amidase [Intrasporangium sp.]